MVFESWEQNLAWMFFIQCENTQGWPFFSCVNRDRSCRKIPKTRKVTPSDEEFLFIRLVLFFCFTLPSRTMPNFASQLSKTMAQSFEAKCPSCRWNQLVAVSELAAKSSVRGNKKIAGGTKAEAASSNVTTYGWESSRGKPESEEARTSAPALSKVSGQKRGN